MVRGNAANVRFGSLADTQKPENFQMAGLGLGMRPLMSAFGQKRTFTLRPPTKLSDAVQLSTVAPLSASLSRILSIASCTSGVLEEICVAAPFLNRKSQ